MDTDNITSYPAEEEDTSSGVGLKISLVIYCVIFVVGTVGNALVIYVTGFRMKRTVNAVWFLNLALADFLFTTFLIFTIISASQQHQWHFGRLMCKLITFVNTVNMFVSVFLLMAISLDRCLCTCVVVWAQNKRTVRKAQVLSAGIWVAAIICATPYAFFRDIMVYEGIDYCTYLYTAKQSWSLHIFRFVMAFLLPFLVIVISYVAIGIRAKSLQRKRKRRSRRIIVAVILAFFFCWLPFHLFYFIELIPGLQSISTIGGPLVICLAFLNSCLNPILYVFMCDEFQKKLQQSICHVLESALAEEHLSFMSSRSLSSHFSRKSDPAAVPVGMKVKGSDLVFTESTERETLSTESVK